jgi:hypothetical protein
MMHTDYDDDDEEEEEEEDNGDDEDDNEEPPMKMCSSSSDTTEHNFSLSARPTMSPTPNEGISALSPTPPMGLTPASSAPPAIHPLLSDDDEDDQENDNDEEKHTKFPLFSADDVRKIFALGVQESRSDNVNNGRTESRDNDNDNIGGEDNGDGASVFDGEMVGPGYATPPRYGGSSIHPISARLSDQELKRAWSEVEQAEQELQEEEAAAILASEKRERRRREIMDAKRSFLDLE